jgi:PucR C-terminal helix-turn-helix domain/GGDEF-like domain
MSVRDQALIADWEGRLSANSLATRILSRLDERKTEVERCALDGLQRENPQFERAASAQFRAEALGHCNDILALMLAIASGSAPTREGDPFHFVAGHAARRARQQFPLAGSLNAYRLAHKGYWDVMRNSVLSASAAEDEKTDCLMLLSEFLLEFFDRISGIMTDAYIAEEKRLEARHNRAHVALIEDLLHGRQPGDLDARDLCARTGIGSGAVVAIAIARIGSVSNGRPIERASELERMSEIVHEALAAETFGKLIDVRTDELLAIVSGRAETAKQVAKAFGGCAEQTGPLARIGISLDALDIAALPQAYQEAERAVEFASEQRPVMHFAEIDLMEFLVRRPDSAARRLIPDWAGRLAEADGGKAGELSRTISRFADCNFNVKRTARCLNLHTNTVYFRLNRIRELTGIDPRSYSGLSLLLTALRMLDAGGDCAAPDPPYRAGAQRGKKIMGYPTRGKRNTP